MEKKLISQRHCTAPLKPVSTSLHSLNQGNRAHRDVNEKVKKLKSKVAKKNELIQSETQ